MSPGHQPVASARAADSKTLVTFQSSGNHFYVLMNTNWGLEALICFIALPVETSVFGHFDGMNQTIIIFRFLFSSPDKL